MLILLLWCDGKFYEKHSFGHVRPYSVICTNAATIWSTIQGQPICYRFPNLTLLVTHQKWVPCWELNSETCFCPLPCYFPDQNTPGDAICPVGSTLWAIVHQENSLGGRQKFLLCAVIPIQIGGPTYIEKWILSGEMATDMEMTNLKSGWGIQTLPMGNV